MTDKQPHTFADMTPEQRQQCAGMWADVTWDSEKPLLAIIFSIPRQDFVQLIEPSTGQAMLGADPKRITPRFTLPRAWNADGTPVKSDYEWCLVDENQHIETEAGQEHVHFPPGTGIHRWTTHWEAVE